MSAAKFVLITGAARRIGRSLALAVAGAGFDVAIHYGSSSSEAETLQQEISALGRKTVLLQADLSNPDETAGLIDQVLPHGTLYGLINNASIFKDLDWQTTTLADWQEHLTVNLTAPFLLSQAFARALPAQKKGRIINLLDWRALRPGPDHLPYTISKAALASLTYSLASALAPRVTVNGLALGAILPPVTGNASPKITSKIPAGRWGSLDAVDRACVFLLTGPDYITGEILHVDGGRHLT